MVQLLADPTLSQGANPALGSAGPDAVESKMMSREEHAQRMRELNMKRAMMRAPRRGWSLTDHQAQQDGAHHSHAAMPQSDLQTTIPENAALPASALARPQGMQLPRRPKMPPPRRSQSVTDKEPEPANQLRPAGDLTLVNLPSELHYNIFDFLDPIDGVCLALAHPRLYDIHRRKNGTVPLSSRYSGPNDREWAWRGAGPIVHPESDKDKAADKKAEDAKAAAAAKQKDLNDLRVKGQLYCRKCGISRCELHRHLKDWFGEGYEYCEIKEMYGPLAGPQAKSYCYMPSPKNPHRCGRHGSKKNSVKQ
ncbi:hypothetical protein PT974_11227 [Cladobotryum mycophilum]|uniref:F-box domain-containing protein n=1 Tax=Cladobotryum mycophilum TaxID=491253 RepID=A0ABR0S548_9HYPO